MKDGLLTVSICRHKTVLTDGSELSREIIWGGDDLKRATEQGDLIESLVKELKSLADEIDRFLEVSPKITTIRLVGGDESLNCFAAILRMYYKDYRLAKLKWI